MSKVGDLSWARPGGLALKQHGFSGVMRYFSHDDGKNLSHDELVDYLNNGLDVGVVWESTANRALSGHDAGVQDAKDALAQATAVGYAGYIYGSVDFDAAESQQPVINDYFNGMNSVLGDRGKAGYGGYWVVKRLLDNGIITRAWQTVAWSGGNVDPRAVLLQDATNDFGGQVDNDQVKNADYGQMKSGSAVTPTPVTPITPAPPVTADSYTVVAGDTLSGIAARFATTYQALAALNGIADPNKISVGEVIKLHGGTPAPIANGQTYTVVSGDTLSAIGAKYGVSFQAIAAANGLSDPNKIYPGQVLRIPGTNVPSPAPAAGVVYIVQSGDTLSTIADKYGTTYQHLAQINGIANPNLIYAGQHIRVS